MIDLWDVNARVVISFSLAIIAFVVVYNFFLNDSPRRKSSAIK